MFIEFLTFPKNTYLRTYVRTYVYLYGWIKHNVRLKRDRYLFHSVLYGSDWVCSLFCFDRFFSFSTYTVVHKKKVFSLLCPIHNYWPISFFAVCLSKKNSEHIAAYDFLSVCLYVFLRPTFSFQRSAHEFPLQRQ